MILKLNKMKRHCHIRFFISSTFEDMEIERNLLQEVFADLSKEFADTGCVIEYVDLRWGVTKEAGFDNRTMKICLDELSRCQKISPKPNFIILLGQRRGWVPLPELIRTSRAKTLLEGAGHVYQSLFNTWYRLDENQLPEAQYVLQTRNERYLDNRIWEEEVVKPLMERMGKLPSATEAEIIEGVFKAAGAADHAIACLRELRDIPADKMGKFIDKGTEKAKETRDALKAKLRAENIYSPDISYSQYVSDSYASEFRVEMHKRISAVIQDRIRETRASENISERTYHQSLSDEKSRFFKGRETVLKEVDAYIHDREAKRAVWFRSDSGMGKSALIAEIHKRYSGTHNIICRYCGESDLSADGDNLMMNIWEEMRSFYPIPPTMPQNLPGDFLKDGRRRKVAFFDTTATEMFRVRMKNLKIREDSKPLLLLIDGMDQLTDDNSEEFSRLFWADGELSPDVRVILTSTKDNRLNTVLQNIDIRELDKMEGKDAIDVVKGILAMHGRTLSTMQYEKVRKVLSTCCGLPVYLTLLGHYLSECPSYVSLDILPSGLAELMQMIIQNVTKASNHDPEFVRLALSLVVADRQGLSQEELLRAISLDDKFMTGLSRHSHHRIIGRSVPHILWSRLYNDLAYFFKIRYGKVSGLIYIYHSTVAKAIHDIYLKAPEDNSRIYGLLADLYKDCDTDHAIMEVISCSFRAFAYTYNHQHRCSRFGEKVVKTVLNLGFLHKKLNLDRNELMQDLIMAHNICEAIDPDNLKKILNIRKDLAGLSKCSREEFIAYCGNLHPESPLCIPLRNALKDLLVDELAGALPYSLTAYASERSGEDPMISNDGKVLLSLIHNRFRVKTEILDHKSASRTYDMYSPVLHIDADKDLKRHLVVTEEDLMIYDSETHTVIERDDTIRNALWASISEDGTVAAYGNLESTWISGLGVMQSGAKYGKLSRCGSFLWMLSKDKIERYNLSSLTSLTTPVNRGGYPDDMSWIILDADKDTCCMTIGNSYVLTHIYPTQDNRHKSMTFTYNQNEKIDKSCAVVNGDRIHIFNSTFGKSLTLRIKDHSISLERVDTAFGVTAVSRNGMFAYCSDEGLCYRCPELLETFKVYEDVFLGINAISASNDGRVIAVTCGKNEFREHCHEILLAVDGKLKKIRIPDRSSSIFCCCAVSPDGSRIWISESNGQLTCLNRDGQIVKEIPDLGRKAAMKFTKDGRYLVAVNGTLLSDVEPIIDIIDKDGNLKSRFNPEKEPGTIGIYDNDDLVLSSTGQLATLSNEYVIDLEKQCLLYENKVSKGKDIWNIEGKTERFVIHKDGNIEYMSPETGAVIKRAYLPDICKWVEVDSGLAAVTRDGRLCMFRP